LEVKEQKLAFLNVNNENPGELANIGTGSKLKHQFRFRWAAKFLVGFIQSNIKEKRIFHIIYKPKTQKAGSSSKNTF
jgi:hypothetical protein